MPSTIFACPLLMQDIFRKGDSLTFTLRDVFIDNAIVEHVASWLREHNSNATLGCFCPTVESTSNLFVLTKSNIGFNISSLFIMF